MHSAIQLRLYYTHLIVSTNFKIGTEAGITEQLLRKAVKKKQRLCYYSIQYMS